MDEIESFINADEGMNSTGMDIGALTWDGKRFVDTKRPAGKGQWWPQDKGKGKGKSKSAHPDNNG